VPCNFTDMELQDAWAALNSESNVVTSRELFGAYKDGLRVLPDSSNGRNLKNVLEKYGEGIVFQCANFGVSKSALEYSRKACVYTGLDPEKDIEFVLAWIVKNKMSRVLRFAMEIESDPNKILQAIVDGKKLEF